MAIQISQTLFFSLGALALAACSKSKTSAVEVTETSLTVENNIVVSMQDPALKIKVDPSFEYLGRHDIRIRDVASGERLVFADVEDGHAQRLFILQFEGFNDGVDNAYRYDLSESPEVAGYRWRSNPYAFNVLGKHQQKPRRRVGGDVCLFAEKEHWLFRRLDDVALADRH